MYVPYRTFGLKLEQNVPYCTWSLFWG